MKSDAVTRRDGGCNARPWSAACDHASWPAAAPRPARPCAHGRGTRGIKAPSAAGKYQSGVSQCSAQVAFGPGAHRCCDDRPRSSEGALARRAYGLAHRPGRHCNRRCSGWRAAGRTQPKSAARAADFKRALAGAPAPLARLYARPDELLDGGPAAFKRQIAGAATAIRSSSTSGPPGAGPAASSSRSSRSRSPSAGKQVAFLAVDGEDARDAAHRFLRKFPVPYPSFFDPHSDDRERLPGRPRLPDDRVLRPQGRARLHEAGRLRLGGGARAGHRAQYAR